MTKFKLKIITPQGIYQEVEIDQINLDTTAGQIGILAHHIPLASGVKVSQMNYIIDGKRTYFSVAGGFIYVNETETTLIANAIESQEEIDLERAQEAKRRAEERLKIQNNEIDMLRAQAALQRAITRIHVKGLQRRTSILLFFLYNSFKEKNSIKFYFIITTKLNIFFIKFKIFNYAPMD